MTSQETERFEGVLGGLKAQVASMLYGRRDRLLISQSADPLDQTRDLGELDLDSQQITLLTTKLRSLETALGKIQEGTFGLCDSCEREIPLRRLEALPWTSLCVACQEAAEARAGEFDDTEREDEPLPVRASLPGAKNGRSARMLPPPGGAPPRNRAPKSGYHVSGAILSRRTSARPSSPTSA